MSEIELKLKKESENIKKLFNGDEMQLKRIKEIMTNSKTEFNFSKFVEFHGLYSKCRPHQHNVSKELIEYACSCFPEQKNEFQQYIRENENLLIFPWILKFIMFPEEFPKNENK